MRKVNLVFVHGFRSGPETWAPLCEKLRERESLRDTVSLHRFSYSSPAVELRPTRRIPRRDEIAEALATFLGVLPEPDRGNPTILIGHSHGGIVIQTMLARRLAKGEARRLGSVAHCVFISTPTNGSDFLLASRRFLARLVTSLNPQEKGLRPLDEEIGELQRDIARNLVYAQTATDHTCPIPVTAIYGNEDAIVGSQSARWIFPDIKALPGDHFSILARPSAELCSILEDVVQRARHHLPADTSLIRTVPLHDDTQGLLQQALTLHTEHFTPAQAVRSDDAEYWLPRYERQFGIRLRMVAALVDQEVTGFLMLHEDREQNVAVVDYLVSRDHGLASRMATEKLVDRLRAIAIDSGVQYVVFEVARPRPGSETFTRDAARVRRFEREGASVIPGMSYMSPSMSGLFDPSGEEPGLLMVASLGERLSTIPWTQVRILVGYIYGTWYRNWFSHRCSNDLPALENYLASLEARVLVDVPNAGSATLGRYLP